MSVASTTANIRFIQTSGTYQSLITCTFGDVFQIYDTTNGTTTYFPNYATMPNQPLFTFVAKNSRSSGQTTLGEVKWYYNDAELFTAAQSYNGLFSQVSGHSEQILLSGNPADIGGQVSGTLKCMAKVQGTDDSLEASYTIRVSTGSDNLYIVTICSANDAGQDNHFYIDSKVTADAGNKCKLGAKTYKGTAGLNNVKYKWYKADAAGVQGWTAINTNPTVEITVKETDVATYAQYKVEAYEKWDATNGFQNLLGMDVQEVLDFSDDVDIEIAWDSSNPDHTLVEGDSTRQSVTLTPSVVSKDSRVALSQYSTCTFNYAVKDPSGNALLQTSGSSLTVGIETAKQCGTDLTVQIDAIAANT